MVETASSLVVAVHPGTDLLRMLLVIESAGVDVVATRRNGFVRVPLIRC